MGQGTSTSVLPGRDSKLSTKLKSNGKNSRMAIVLPNQRYMKDEASLKDLLDSHIHPRTSEGAIGSDNIRSNPSLGYKEMNNSTLSNGPTIEL